MIKLTDQNYVYYSAKLLFNSVCIGDEGGGGAYRMFMWETMKCSTLLDSCVLETQLAHKDGWERTFGCTPVVVDTCWGL